MVRYHTVQKLTIDADVLCIHDMYLCFILGIVYLKEKWTDEVATDRSLCILQQWLVASFLLTKTTFMRLDPMTKEWIFGAARTWKCPLG